MLYLMEWAYVLCGRSGASMEGLSPLSFPALQAWSEMMGLELDALEVHALLALDAVIRRPEAGEPEKEPEPNKEDHSWPT